MNGDGSWLNRFDESEGKRGWEGRTVGTGPGGMEGRWGGNCCRAETLVVDVVLVLVLFFAACCGSGSGAGSGTGCRTGAQGVT